ncbi:hypothetical protein EYF80_026895 [Liparis tanakae]|uniref:Uncharacterized protein n=1 Tax=Liparis tanakae TaxID=230148 RepID=A0A4Z2HBC1_9TELE|nr:hypothetical protein EYF80_026895 [Liparis tanakae]
MVCSTISAAPRSCSRACWYSSFCFSISFSSFSYLGEAVLRQCDQLLFSGGTDVEPDRKQALQGGNDETLPRVSNESIELQTDDSQWDQQHNQCL